MRAITVSDYGSPDVLTISEREQPTMRSGDLLVKVQAVEVTKSDTELRSLNFSVKWFAIPLRFVLGLRRPKREILGMYFSGQVVKLSEGCSRFHVGDEIFGSSQLRLGAYGDYLTVPENYTLSLKPPHISFEEAAAVPLGGLNALHFMRLAKLSSGKRILINGGGGSIGLFAIQIAKAQGAHVTVVDAPHKEAVIRSVGADHFVDYTNQNFTDEPEKFDVFFDMVVGSSFKDCLSVLKKDGSYLTGNPTLLRMFQCFKTRYFSQRSASFLFAKESQEELDTLQQMLNSGQLRSPIDRVLPLEAAAEAHRMVETEQRQGLVVLAHESRPQG